MEIKIVIRNRLAEFERGLSLAYSFLGLIFVVSLFPITTELFRRYFFYNYIVQPKQSFLFGVFVLVVEAWTLTFLLMSFVYQLRNEKVNFIVRAKNSFQNLPKVMFSYFGLFSIISLSLLFLPLALIIAFFIWAPFFCAAEACVVDSKQKKVREDDGEFDQKEERFFLNKREWEIGLWRSFKFAGNNLIITFRLLLLIWFVWAFPTALSLIFLQFEFFVFSEIITTILASVFNVVIIGLFCGQFLSLLPDFAAKEIGIKLPPFSVLNRKEKGIKIFPIVAVFNILLTWYVSDHFYIFNRRPSFAQVAVKEVNIQPSYVDLKIRFSDARNCLNWLNWKLLQIHFDQDSFEDDKFKDPILISVFSEDGTRLDRDYFIPTKQSVDLLVRFELMESDLAKEKFSLYYLFLNEKNKPLFKGSLKHE